MDSSPTFQPMRKAAKKRHEHILATAREIILTRRSLSPLSIHRLAVAMILSLTRSALRKLISKTVPMPRRCTATWRPCQFGKTTKKHFPRVKLQWIWWMPFYENHLFNMAVLLSTTISKNLSPLQPILRLRQSNHLFQTTQK